MITLLFLLLCFSETLLRFMLPVLKFLILLSQLADWILRRKNTQPSHISDSFSNKVQIYKHASHASFDICLPTPTPRSFYALLPRPFSKIHRSSILKEDSNMKITQNVSINKCNSEEKKHKQPRIFLFGSRHFVNENRANDSALSLFSFETVFQLGPLGKCSLEKKTQSGRNYVDCTQDEKSVKLLPTPSLQKKKRVEPTRKR